MTFLQFRKIARWSGLRAALLGAMGFVTFVIQLYGCAVVLFFLVLTASVLMITSSLNSNVARRTEFFGMLRCVGVVLSVELQWVF